MKNLETKITQLLVGDTQMINVRCPKILLERLKGAIIKIDPKLARKERGAITEAVLHFSAYGVLKWEEDEGGSSEEDVARGSIPPPKKTEEGFRHAPQARRFV